MNARATFRLLGCLVGLLGCCLAAQAQQPTALTDVLLLTSGQEVRGRVLTITPSEVSYLPLPDSARLAPPRPDTLRLPAATVFLVRFANGTSEVLAPLGPTPDRDPAQAALLGLTTEQRRQLGAQHARRYYHQSGPFWGAFASAIAATPVYGAVPAACISLRHVAAHNLMTPEPQLLLDPAYASGYQRQANRQKAGRTWAGYGAGSAAYLAFVALLVIGLSGGL